MPDAPSADPTPAGAALVLLAAGTGTRSGHAINKVFLPLAGRSVVTWSLDWTAQVGAITRTLLVVRDGEQAQARGVLDRESPGRAVELVTGGATRHESEYNALRVLAPAIENGTIDVIVVHDAARPLAGRDLFADVIEAAREYGAVVPGRRVPAALAVPGRDLGVDTTMICVQTPQAFRAGDLLRSYAVAATEGFTGSDTASCVEHFGSADVHWLEASATNIKITFADDLLVARCILDHGQGAPAATARAAGGGASGTPATVSSRDPGGAHRAPP